MIIKLSIIFHLTAISFLFFLVRPICTHFKVININMCLKKKSKKNNKRPPRQPRQGPYQKVNAYTLKPCFEQIITFFVVVIMIALHSVFNVGAICLIDNPILYIMLILHYILIVILIVLYIRITILDPVDQLVIDPVKNASISIEISMKRRFRASFINNERDQYKSCPLCRSYVHFKSYHCNRCNRCTQNFDHHCVYLNSCIGGKNYELFICILLVFIFFMLNMIGQNVWLFVATLSDSYQYITADDLRVYLKNEWVLLGIIGFVIGFFIPTLILCVFHFYMSCYLDITTMQFIQSQTESSASYSGSGRSVDSNQSYPKKKKRFTTRPNEIDSNEIEGVRTENRLAQSRGQNLVSTARVGQNF